jgi:GTP-binding protein
MKVTSVEFIKSALEKSHWTTDGRPEVAFLGRSNVGKSSLINSLLLRKGLARTSNTPGRTQSVNFFLINESFYFADLPGYGYARVSKSTRADWGQMAEEYLSERRELALCIQLVDVRHHPTALDIQLNEWLEFNSKPHLIVATKADKISKNDLMKSLRIIETVLNGASVLPFSLKTRQGSDAIWAVISTAINKK